MDTIEVGGEEVDIIDAPSALSLRCCLRQGRLDVD
jgi:hypothetical protein